jgi:hypothetical protein
LYRQNKTSFLYRQNKTERNGTVTVGESATDPFKSSYTLNFHIHSILNFDTIPWNHHDQQSPRQAILINYNTER